MIKRLENNNKQIVSQKLGSEQGCEENIGMDEKGLTF